MLNDFAMKVIALCTLHHGSVISWGRTVKHNADVGGHPTSLHKCFLAADIVFDTVANSVEAQDFAKRLGLHWKRNGEKTLHVQALPVMP